MSKSRCVPACRQLCLLALLLGAHARAAWTRSLLQGSLSADAGLDPDPGSSPLGDDGAGEHLAHTRAAARAAVAAAMASADGAPLDVRLTFSPVATAATVSGSAEQTDFVARVAAAISNSTALRQSAAGAGAGPERVWVLVSDDQSQPSGAVGPALALAARLLLPPGTPAAAAEILRAQLRASPQLLLQDEPPLAALLAAAEPLPAPPSTWASDALASGGGGWGGWGAPWAPAVGVTSDAVGWLQQQGQIVLVQGGGFASLSTAARGMLLAAVCGVGAIVLWRVAVRAARALRERRERRARRRVEAEEAAARRGEGGGGGGDADAEAEAGVGQGPAPETQARLALWALV